MECRRCGSPLERPGDYCLVCRAPNADSVVLELGRERARATVLYEDEPLGTRTVTTTPEEGEAESVELRNFAGRIADEVLRKRPEVVYVTGERDVIGAVRAELHHEFRRVPAENPVEAALDGGEDGLAVVDVPPSEKLGGAHSTLIGGRDGRRVVETVAAHPHVKKLIPGPIENGASSTEGGVRAKVTRAGTNGNVRLLIRDGSSVQENRVVTTAGDRETGERIREDLNEALADEEFR